MPATTEEVLRDLADMYAFLGNSLLKPMTQTSHVGLSAEFWAALPHFNSAEIESALGECESFAHSCSAKSEEQAVTEVSVEYTRLLVGPPSPAASPWETTNGPKSTNIGFGEATFQMRRLLRDAGFELSNENHQYEDHIGIELLYLSVLCQKAADDGAAGGDMGEEAAEFIEAHPLRWIGRLEGKVQTAAPDGYYRCILKLAKALMEWQVRQ